MGRKAIPIEFTKQHQPLYCFKIVEDDDAMKLVKYKIFEYDSLQLNRSTWNYRFEGKMIESTNRVDTIRNDKMDRVVNKKFFTFNPDPQIVEKAFDNYFKGCLVDATIKMNNAEQRYDLWRKRNE